MRDAAEIERFRQAKLQGDYGIANVYAGQSVGLLNRVRSAREIVESLTEEGFRRLAGVANLLQ